VTRPRQEVASGLVVVDKPAGLTSHDVVSRIRRLAGTRKIGHAGTLDPMATGVLVLGIERATRLLGHLMLTEKAYDATIRLGQATSTDDAEGDLVAQHSTAGLDEADVRAALAGFVGNIEQVPTAVSAIKVDGKRAYQRVREGEQVELAARRVVVHELTVHEVTVGQDLVDVRISVRCSSGTYIRAIARDLGRELGVGGHLVALRRTAVGPFTLARAHTLDTLAEHWSTIPLSAAARDCFPAYDLTAEQAVDVRVGRALDEPLAALTALFAPDGEFLALYEPRGDLARPVAVFVG
jgi:tRNA pseudouridine55 synthase